MKYTKLAALVLALNIPAGYASTYLTCTDATKLYGTPIDASKGAIPDFTVRADEYGAKFSEGTPMSWLNSYDPDRYRYNDRDGSFSMEYRSGVDVMWGGNKFIEIIMRGTLNITAIYARCR